LKKNYFRSLMMLFFWLSLAMPALVLASLPASAAAQGLLSIAAVLLVSLLKPFATNTIARFSLMAIGSMIVFRYWIWRLTVTLPDPGFDLSFALAAILFATETYSILVFFLNAFITADPTSRAQPPKVDVHELPSVDILVPSYNEPIDMLSVTLSAAKNMIYPHDKRTVVLCDDGGTDQRCDSDDPEMAKNARKRRKELQELCQQLGVVYSTRARNIHAKAGNMSAALESLNGDLVVVFDADHVPSRDFLARTVGYFVKDPQLFLVQTPHFFINEDPIQRNLGLTCPPENEMFYSMIHKGLDRWGGAFFCGSAAVIRRAALESVGGFAGETITEDAETALEIHSNGWRSLYLDRAMIGGLQPESFSSFIQQRGRWASGMMQMLVLKNPLFRGGLSLMQRLCYINSMAFWLFPMIRLVYLIAPLAYLFFGIEMFVATFNDAMVYVLSYMAISFLVQNALFAKYRWPLISEIYEVAQAPYLAKAIIKTLIKPRGAKFNVTAKDETLVDDHISNMYKPLLSLFLLMTAGVVALVIRWQIFPGDHSVLAVVGAWAVFNFLLVSLSLAAVAETKQRRTAIRVDTNAAAGLRWEGSGEDDVPGLIVDSSTGGARVQLTRSVGGSTGNRLPAAGDLVELTPHFPEARHLQRSIKAVVKNVKQVDNGQELGVFYLPEQPIEVREAVAYLIFGSSENWLDIRRASQTKKGLVAGLFYVLWLSLKLLPNTVLRFLREPARRIKAAENPEPDMPPAHIVAFGADFKEEEWRRQHQPDTAALQTEPREAV